MNVDKDSELHSQLYLKFTFTCLYTTEYDNRKVKKRIFELLAVFVPKWKLLNKALLV